MLQHQRYAVAFAILAVVFASGRAEAVPMGTGTLLIELNGSGPDNYSSCAYGTYADQNYDVFGDTVNLGTSVGHLLCTGGVVDGVQQPFHCVSSPDDSLLISDAGTSSVCLDPPTCNSSSFVTETSFALTGSLASTFPPNLTFTSDGQTTSAGSGSVTIPGCPLTGGVLKYTGTFGINAFQTQATPVGDDQTVTFPETTFFNPLTNEEQPVDVAITFSQVSGSGTTTVTATSNSSGELTANFSATVNGYQAAFLDIRTTATIVPPIEICSSYADVDDDGFLDGTSPPLSEDLLSFMHGEGGTFVDRTSSRDPVTNTICAQVDSLSPFAVLVRTSGICETPGEPCDDGDGCTATDICDGSLECVGSGSPDCSDGNPCTDDVCESPLGCTHSPDVATGCNGTGGKSILSIKNDDDNSKDKVLFKWLKGTSPLSDFGNPTSASGYTLCVFDSNKVLASATAPAASTCGASPCWSTSATGVSYSDSSSPPDHDGVQKLSGKADTSGGAKILLKAGGETLPTIQLNGIVAPVTVQLRTTDAGCWEEQFSAGDQKKNDGDQFKAVHVGP